ncbi:GxxExxY protein [Fischerella sp. JS2]|uniref:GxxExxY protein n=1 Tax=Fischerella sp. JS2 TaxID=2597771 RepID=UPI0028E8B4E3|nr:GxxExxY protein [Fischerella sp. JS2]
MHPDELNRITQKIIGCAYTVSNVLGVGFLEKVYENALAHELRKAGLRLKQQYNLQILYDSIVVGEYFVDLIVEECVLVELKAVKNLDDGNFAQCMSYLKASRLKVCLLINFGHPRVEIKRIVR